MTKASDIQIGGNHYKGVKYEPYQFFLNNRLNYCLSNAIKYVVRYPNKNPDDLDKAIHCLELYRDWALETEYAYDHNDIGEIAKFARQYSEPKATIILKIVALDCYSQTIEDGKFVNTFNSDDLIVCTEEVIADIKALKKSVETV